jgi:hypothetical protein
MNNEIPCRMRATARDCPYKYNIQYRGGPDSYRDAPAQPLITQGGCLSLFFWGRFKGGLYYSHNNANLANK